ncbi:MAG: hypothetical protein JW741_15425 [Sedimentisphaerales bacterium]|nr:hypothetical protein [Sedimentisphaerales bacterium]
MAIEAPLSRYKRNSIKIYIVACILAALWFGYDGYLSKKFIQQHTDEQGNPDSTLVFNRISPPFFLGGVALLALYFYAVRGRKVVADDDALLVAGKVKIPYDAIVQIDKTHYEKNGCFVVTYRNEGGREVNRKLSDRAYDNLKPILEHLVAQIT